MSTSHGDTDHKARPQQSGSAVYGLPEETNGDGTSRNAVKHNRPALRFLALLVLAAAVALATIACQPQDRQPANSGSTAEASSAEVSSSSSPDATIVELASSAAHSDSNASAASDADTDSSTEQESAPGKANYVQGVVLANFGDADPAEALSQLREQTDIEQLELGDSAGGYVEIILPSGITVEDAVELFAQSSVVESVQPNFTYTLMEEGAAGAGLLAGLPLDYYEAPEDSGQFLPNDASIAKQWALDSINAPGAWNLVRTEGAVTVAVVDDCFNIDHEDLAANVVAPYNAVSQEENDDMGASGASSHGTHVAGIVAAEANNGVGVAGVSFNARVMPIRTMDDDGIIDTGTLLKAYDYLLDNAQACNVRIVNVSLGMYVDSSDWEATDDALLGKIDKAWDAGIVTVASSGNAGTYDGTYRPTPFSCYPGDYDKVVNVISLKQDSAQVHGVTRLSSSNFNEEGRANKDISAPGSSIYSTLSDSNASYGTKSGTSMAAPCVAGVLALVFAANPDLTPQEAVDILYSTACDLDDTNEGFDDEYGWGEVDARAAVEASLPEASDNVDACESSASGDGDGDEGGPAHNPDATSDSSSDGNGQTSGEKSSGSSDANGANGSGTGGASGAGGTMLAAKSSSSLARTSIAKASVSISKASYTFRNAKIAPKPTVKLGKTVLKSGRDYTVSYAKNKNVGKATISVTGKGNYKGTVKRSFTIKKAANTLKVTPKKAAVRVSQAKTRAAKVTLARSKTMAVSKARGQLSFSKVSGSKWLSIAKNTGKVSVKKNTPRGTYKIRVRVRAAGTGNYKRATRTVTLKIRVV